MNIDPNFWIGCIGAAAPEALRLYNLRSQPVFRWSWGYLMFSIPFLIVGGFIAWVLEPSTRWAAFYSGLTAPVLLTTVLKDTAKAQKELEEVEKERDQIQQEREKLQASNQEFRQTIEELKQKLEQLEQKSSLEELFELAATDNSIGETKDIQAEIEVLDFLQLEVEETEVFMDADFEDLQLELDDLEEDYFSLDLFDVTKPDTRTELPPPSPMLDEPAPLISPQAPQPSQEPRLSIDLLADRNQVSPMARRSRRTPSISLSIAVAALVGLFSVWFIKQPLILQDSSSIPADQPQPEFWQPILIIAVLGVAIALFFYLRRNRWFKEFLKGM
ncbi:MAG: hypothetical protein HC879_06595 [Leptolyngbyaceae cyanobacterium SL_5_9]|nr:hypothetical protein [Leptolyngbyaceae cyanobacterium SL_5_9]NJO72500.1 hypothetical protein [Leptolyngbyaceae cyanobacterium RM1_406_9]